ncbi:sulfotransferase [Cryomorphaceae bacterium]|nr:sulfotransferase [Cryomorphaceae bacterium]
MSARERIKALKRRAEDAQKTVGFAIRPPEKRTGPFPDFLCIGAQKSGTTWLQDCLIHHPDIFLPPEKEVHFFDWKYYRSYDWYQKKFSTAGERLIGEITPGYSTIAKHRIQHIARFNPSAKIIFLLRNPIERAWSHSKMVLCKIQGRPFESISDDQWKAHFDGFKSTKRGSYTEVYQDWARVFGNDRVFVGFYEQIVSDPEGLLREIMQFLEVSVDIDTQKMPFGKRSNVGLQAEIPPQLRPYLQAKYKDEIEACCALFGKGACNWS